MNKVYDIFLAGKFIKTKKELIVTEKFTGKTYATTFLADEETLNAAIEAAITAKGKMSELSSLDKFRILQQIETGIREQRKHLAEVLAIESGKPLKYALGEIDRAAQTFSIAAEESKRVPREYMSLDWTENGRNKAGLVKYFPIGVVGGIAPFNFPMNLAVHKIAPAIAAGCPIILKPASSTPLSTLELAKIISNTDLPHGAVSILPMDRKTGNNLVTDDRINLISFTGSPEIGWELKKQSGKKKIVLELGGNAGVIISGSTPIESIIDKCVSGAFAYSGQICIHAQRFYVHESVYDSFLKLFSEKTKALNYSDPTSDKTDISVMIDEANANRVEAWIREAIDSGAQLLLGGGKKGQYIEPTILCNTNTKMKVNAEEVFGPVVCIEKYNGPIDNAIKQINDTIFGLQCGVFTDSIEELDTCFKNIEVGGVIHNDVPTLRFDQMPYGGIKESGLGREGVRYAMHDMLEPRILVKSE